MKVLFDHCVPRPLRRHLPGYNVTTAKTMGWDKLENGDLLSAAELKFDVLITSDKNIPYQQNLAGRRIGVIVLPTNILPTVISLAPKVLAALDGIQPGGRIEIDL